MRKIFQPSFAVWISCVEAPCKCPKWFGRKAFDRFFDFVFSSPGFAYYLPQRFLMFVFFHRDQLTPDPCQVLSSLLFFSCFHLTVLKHIPAIYLEIRRS